MPSSSTWWHAPSPPDKIKTGFSGWHQTPSACVKNTATVDENIQGLRDHSSQKVILVDTQIPIGYDLFDLLPVYGNWSMAPQCLRVQHCLLSLGSTDDERSVTTPVDISANLCRVQWQVWALVKQAENGSVIKNKKKQVSQETVQSFVRKVNMAGELSWPWGAPVLIHLGSESEL